MNIYIWNSVVVALVNSLYVINDIYIYIFISSPEVALDSMRPRESDVTSLAFVTDLVLGRGKRQAEEIKFYRGWFTPIWNYFMVSNTKDTLFNQLNCFSGIISCILVPFEDFTNCNRQHHVRSALHC